MLKNATVNPKRIVYLIGAGATQAESDYLGAAAINLLMHNIDDIGEGMTTRIFNRVGSRRSDFSEADEGIDIEKLISLLAASGISRHSRLAETIREQYFMEICSSLTKSRIISTPRLALVLLSMHEHPYFKKNVEVLSGIITTNHDGLFQIASQAIYGGINVGFPFASTNFTPVQSENVPPILQLHGSFTWKMGVPIEIEALGATSKYSKDTVWIPPTVLKETKTYPFNKLSGMAYELLARKCDVLRVIGASLTQNDWNILSLIFNAQRHRESVRGSAFKVELIMPQKSGIKIVQECGYLRQMTPIGFLTDGNFAEYKEEYPVSSELANPFAYWLKEKSQFHHNLHHFDADASMDETVGAVA